MSFAVNQQVVKALAADIFDVDSALTLQRPCCLFVIEVGSRYGRVLGVTRPSGRSVDRPADP